MLSDNEFVHWAQHLKDLMKKKETAVYIHSEQAPQLILLPKLDTFAILDISPLELARQLTLIESKIFSQITPSELFRKAWAKPKASPNVMALIDRFNQVSYWIATEITALKDTKKRTLAISKFIEIGQHFNEMNNFNGIMEITSALNLNLIQRLKNDWKNVSPKHIFIYKNLIELMNPNSNWTTFRKAVSERALPVLPFQGVFLSDFTFIDELPDTLSNGLINFEKMSFLGKALVDIHTSQSVPYNFQESKELIAWQANQKVLSEDELWEASRKCETSEISPRRVNYEDSDTESDKKEKLPQDEEKLKEREKLKEKN